MAKECLGLLVLATFVLSSCAFVKDDQSRWGEAVKVLETAISNGAFPGCVALIASKEGILFKTALGHFTYGVPPPLNKENPPMTMDTLFDMASCTKVTSTLSAVAQFYQRGELKLNTRVVDIIGPQFGQNGKKDIEVIHLLVHSSGFPPDPVPFYSVRSFGCPESQKEHPGESFSCQKKIYTSLMAQKLQHPINTVYVYSDLGFITLMYVVGRLARNFGYIKESDLIGACNISPSSPESDQCYFEAYCRKYVFHPLRMTHTGFLPPKISWKDCAPAENDTSYLHRVIQAQVSDGNAYALGGIAGHAGLFSRAEDVWILMNRTMFAPERDDVFINRTTADYFIKEYNHTQSSRAIGWNTNDPTVFDYGWDQLCGNMSANTFTHVGYTGTQMCGDPDRQLITILLTNRVYPTDANLKIENVRRAFNSAVVGAFDNMMKEKSLK